MPRLLPASWSTALSADTGRDGSLVAACGLAGILGGVAGLAVTTHLLGTNSYPAMMAVAATQLLATACLAIWALRRHLSSQALSHPAIRGQSLLSRQGLAADIARHLGQSPDGDGQAALILCQAKIPAGASGTSEDIANTEDMVGALIAAKLPPGSPEVYAVVRTVILRGRASGFATTHPSETPKSNPTINNRNPDRQTSQRLLIPPLQPTTPCHASHSDCKLPASRRFTTITPCSHARSLSTPPDNTRTKNRISPSASTRRSGNEHSTDLPQAQRTPSSLLPPPSPIANTRLSPRTSTATSTTNPFRISPPSRRT